MSQTIYTSNVSITFKHKLGMKLKIQKNRNHVIFCLIRQTNTMQNPRAIRYTGYQAWFDDVCKEALTKPRL